MKTSSNLALLSLFEVGWDSYMLASLKSLGEKNHHAKSRKKSRKPDAKTSNSITTPCKFLHKLILKPSHLLVSFSIHSKLIYKFFIHFKSATFSLFIY